MRFRSLLPLVAIAALGACSNGGDAAPSASPTTGRTTTDPNATTEAFVASYEAACEASIEASAELEQPRDDGGTWPPSPSKDGLRDWAVYTSQLSSVYADLVAELRTIPVPEEIAAEAETVVDLRQQQQLTLERVVEAADAGEPEAFSSAFTDWVADGMAAGTAEEALGITCTA